MNILVLTDTDLDGAGSALFIKWLYTNKARDIVIIESTESTIKNEFISRQTTIDHYDKVFVLDLDLSEDIIPFVDRDNVVVIDHHLGHASKKHLYTKAKAIIDPYTSCVGLMQKVFAKGITLTPKQEELISYINDYDCYNIKYRDSLKLNVIFRTFNTPKVLKFVEAFKDGFREYTSMEKNAIKLYLNKFKEQIEQAQLFTCELKGYTVISTFADFAINEVAHYLLCKTGAEICIVVNLKAKFVSFRRSKRSNVDVSILAKKFCEGGGSPAAAGGKLTEEFINLTKIFKPC